MFKLILSQICRVAGFVYFFFFVISVTEEGFIMLGILQQYLIITVTLGIAIGFFICEKLVYESSLKQREDDL